MPTVRWAELQNAASDAGFGTVPVDEYDVYVNKSEVTQTTTGKDMFKLQYKIENGPYANQSVFDQMVVTEDNPNALGFFFRKMTALGLGPEFFASEPTNDKIAQALLNKRARIKVGIREWNGTNRNEVQSIKPAVTPAPPAQNPGGPGLDQFAPASPVPGNGGGMFLPASTPAGASTAPAANEPEAPDLPF